MTFKRDQFKATNVADLKKLRDDEDKIVGSSKGGDRIDIQDGLNKIRIAPKFPHEKDFYHMKMVHWGAIETSNSKDGETKRVPILNSRIHGGTELDIFEEYIAQAKKELVDDAEKAKIITDYNKGIGATTSWVAYGWKLVKDQKPKFGDFEFKKSVRDQLNSLTIIEDEDEAIETDVFTDIDEGKPILLTYDSKAKKPADYYKIQLAKNALPLTDEMFEELSGKTPLSERLRNVYTINDFEKALEAIQNFDIENEIDIFDTEEFKATIKKVKAQYGSESKKEDKAKATKSNVSTAKSKKVEEDEEEEEKPVAKAKKGDQFDKMDREELKEFISENDLEVVVKKADSDDDIRVKIRKAIAESADSPEEEEVEDEPEAKVEKKEVVTSKPKVSVTELRAQLAAKNAADGKGKK